MGNKNGSVPNKKLSRSQQAYQQEQLNKVQREIQAQNSSTSLSSRYAIEYDNEEIISTNQVYKSAENHANNHIRAHSIQRSLTNTTEQKPSQGREKSNDPLRSSCTISNTNNKGRHQSKRSQQSLSQFPSSQQKESSKRQTKKSIIEIENQLINLIKKENYFGSLEKLFEILFLNKKLYGNNSEQVAFTMHRMSRILFFLGRLEEALKYEYESCQITKLILGGQDVNFAKNLIYISKLLWYFKKYNQSFYYVLEAYNISELPTNKLHIELKQMIGEVSLEMSNFAHDNEHFILSFKLRVLAFQSKRNAFLFDETYIDDDLTMLAQEVWNYKQGVFLLQMIPTQNYSITSLPINTNSCTGGDENDKGQEDNCPICYIEFNQGDQQKELLCTHTFHSNCIDRWIIKNQKCPMCRKSQDLSEYLTYQQNRLLQLQKEQNEKILNQQQRGRIDQNSNTEQTLTTKKSDSNIKIPKLKLSDISKQQNSSQQDKQSSQPYKNLELVQLSPRTSATFTYLKKDLQKKDVDIFMVDYNQYFNLLPLPQQQQQQQQQQEQNNNNNKIDKKDSNIANSDSNDLQSQQQSPSLSSNKQIPFEIIEQTFQQQQQYQSQLDSSENKFDDSQLPSIRNNQSIAVNSSVTDQISGQHKFANFYYHNQQHQEDEIDDDEEEEKEEQKYSFNRDQRSYSQSNNQKYQYQYTQNNRVASKDNYSEIQAFKKSLNEQKIDSAFDKLVSNNGFIASENTEQSPYEQLNEQKQFYYFSEYEGIMAEKPQTHQDNLNRVQQFDLINYDESSEEENSCQSDNIYSDVEEDDNYVSRIQIVQKNPQSTNQFKRNLNLAEKSLQKLASNKQQQQQQQQQLLQQLCDEAEEGDECLFTEPYAPNSHQQEIQDFNNTKSIHNRYLYFEQEQNREYTENDLPGKNFKTINYANFSFQQSLGDQNELEFTSGVVNKTTLFQNEERACCQSSTNSCKHIDDADVNFDEEGISESSNKMLAINGQRANEILISSLQKTFNGNSITHSNYNNNSPSGSANDNLHYTTINPIHITTSEIGIEKQTAIHNTSSFQPIKSPIISNATKNYYMNEEFDIFDKKTFTKFSNNQKIDLFDDDQKENKYLFDNSHLIINNNKYSQMNFF